MKYQLNSSPTKECFATPPPVVSFQRHTYLPQNIEYDYQFQPEYHTDLHQHIEYDYEFQSKQQQAEELIPVTEHNKQHFKPLNTFFWFLFVFFLATLVYNIDLMKIKVPQRSIHEFFSKIVDLKIVPIQSKQKTQDKNIADLDFKIGIVAKNLNIKIESIEQKMYAQHRQLVETSMSYVNDQIYKYNSDKTGMADFASEPSGARVLFTRCDEPYEAHTRWTTFYGIPLVPVRTTPRSVIKVDFYKLSDLFCIGWY